MARKHDHRHAGGGSTNILNGICGFDARHIQIKQEYIGQVAVSQVLLDVIVTGCFMNGFHFFTRLQKKTHSLPE